MYRIRHVACIIRKKEINMTDISKRKLNEISGNSLDVRGDLIERLTSVVPEIASDGKIDIDKLKNILLDKVEDSPERYNFTWNGKNQAIKLTQQSTTATLKPNKDKSKNWDETQNIYIEGDNLETLKLLQKSYSN